MEELTAVSIHLGAAFCTIAYGKASDFCDLPTARERETCVVQPTSLYYVKKNAWAGAPDTDGSDSAWSGGPDSDDSDSEAEYEATHWGWGAETRHEVDLAGSSGSSSGTSHGLYVAKFMTWGHLASSMAPARGWWQGEQKFTTPGDIPHGLSLVTVISDYLSQLAGFAVDAVNRRYSSNITMGDIQWCLTVPSIWDDSALKTMREYVERAGMVTGPFCPPQAAAQASSHPLLFVLEWEAAALSCFRGVSMEEGSEVLGVDVGSDTTNIVILKEHQGGFVLVEGRSADGCCISDVDKSFYDMLRARIGSACFDEVVQQSPVVRRHMQDMWEALRNSYGGDGDPNYLELPQTQTLQIPWEAYDRARDNPVEDYDEIKVDMRLMLDPVAERIIQLTQEQLSRPDVKGLFLMGESSLPGYLGLKMKAAFGTKFGDRMRIPPDPRSTMCQGAVTFGLSPALQASRRTYELKLQRPCSLFDRPKLDVWTALGRVLEKHSEFDESLRACLEAIHMAGIEAVHSADLLEALVASLVETHGHSIRHSKLVMEAVVELQFRRLRHSQSEMETAHAVTKSERDTLQAEIRAAESLMQTQRLECEIAKLGYHAEQDTLKAEMDRIAAEKRDIEVAAGLEREVFVTQKARLEEAAREHMSCQICEDKPRNAVILPCGHAQFCDVCLAQHRKANPTCPTCRVTIKDVVPFFP